MNLREKIKKRPFMASLITVNLAGTLFGMYYYLPQLASSDIIFWPLIPDSPTATLLFVLSLLLISKQDFQKKKGLQNVLYSLAFIGNIKYGIWTVYALLEFMPYFMNVNSSMMYFFLVFSHLGMFLQAFLVLPYIKIDRYTLLAPSIYLFNDVVDYSFQVHTSLPEAQGMSSNVAYVAFGLTLISAIVLYIDSRYSFIEINLLETK